MGKFAQFVKWTALVAVVFVALVVVVTLSIGWWISRQFDQRVADLRAAGQPASISDLAPEPVPPGEDAAVLLRQVAADTRAFVDRAYKIYDLGDGEPSEEQLAAVRDLIVTYEHIFPVIHEASLRPQYSSQVDYSQPDETVRSQELLDNISGNRAFARALRIRADVLSAEGEREEAVQAGVDLLRLCRHFDQEPALVGYLVALACRESGIDSINRTLRDGVVSRAVRTTLETELALHDDMAGFQQALLTERAYSLDAYRNMVQGLDWLPPAWFFKRSAVAMADQMDQLYAVADRPSYETEGERAEMKVAAADHTLLKLAWPSIDATWDARDRVRANLRCLRILNALQAFEEKNGNEPAELANLGLPIEVTTDPFTGEPLKWRKTDAGWLIYSVGRDGVDNGGQFDDATDHGVAPVGWQPPEEESTDDEPVDDDQTVAP